MDMRCTDPMALRCVDAGVNSTNPFAFIGQCAFGFLGTTVLGLFSTTRFFVGRFSSHIPKTRPHPFEHAQEYEEPRVTVSGPVIVISNAGVSTSKNSACWISEELQQSSVGVRLCLLSLRLSDMIIVNNAMANDS